MKIREIVNGSGELIGANDNPESGSDLDTVAHKTTDDNIRIGRQNYRYDMMARFGFLGMPFYEGEETDDSLINEFDNMIYESKIELMSHYYKNPNKLKSDYRKNYNKKINECSSDISKSTRSLTDKSLDVVENYFRKIFDKKKITESSVVEDKMINNRSEVEITKRTSSNDIKDKNLTNLAGLISKKMDKSDINKLITLLEKNE